ncbi:MAG: hypothetical protein LBO75_03585, partial [Bifidobacteriaceae bacterium]|nr:hypothetical protein [Bifidobacteriaceae bacterium]
GTVLFLFNLAFSIVYSILSAVLTASLLWTSASFILPLLGLLWLVPLIFVILGIVNASQGKLQPLPVIGKITIIK